MTEIISKYEKAGSPKNCRLDSCGKPFEGRCVQGRDGEFYCSFSCADLGARMGDYKQAARKFKTS
jgi:hypothetical protein